MAVKATGKRQDRFPAQRPSLHRPASLDLPEGGRLSPRASCLDADMLTGRQRRLPSVSAGASMPLTGTISPRTAPSPGKSLTPAEGLDSPHPARGTIRWHTPLLCTLHIKQVFHVLLLGP
jgi:hypothetical protein